MRELVKTAVMMCDDAVSQMMTHCCVMMKKRNVCVLCCHMCEAAVFVCEKQWMVV